MYKITETNTGNTENMAIERVEFLFDINENQYKIQDTNFVKKFVCACGSCELFFKNNGKQENIRLGDITKTIQVDKGVSVEINNYTDDIKVVVEYLR